MIEQSDEAWDERVRKEKFAKKGLTILGSTGSIGQQTLAVTRYQTELSIYALTANTAVDLLVDQCEAFNPSVAVIADPNCYGALVSALAERGLQTEARSGAEGLVSVAVDDEVSHVMAAIVGGSGLMPTYAAAEAGKTVLLANKEALVMSGALFMSALANGEGEVIPVDSEHNAIFQCLGNERTVGREVAKILLTGSGGPFRSRPVSEFETITPEEACRHPNWSMGRKISVDSATMMNKGLELIEACFLFGVGSEFIDIVIHPQSIVHSMVAFKDGSVLAQMGKPDMRTPIASALAWPSRMDSGVSPLAFENGLALDFQPPDIDRFPLLTTCRRVASAGQSEKVVLNAANEVAVEAFLAHRISFNEMTSVIEASLDEISAMELESIEAVIACDERARAKASEWVNRWS